MKSTTTQPLQQIHAVLDSAEHALTESTEAATYRQEQDIHESCLLKLCPAETWHKDSYRNGCARPILITQHHQQQLEELHEALTLAITDVVQRWWTDDAAQLPQRMPLPKEEEELLQVSCLSWVSRVPYVCCFSSHTNKTVSGWRTKSRMASLSSGTF
jgi:hypothetical protein